MKVAPTAGAFRAGLAREAPIVADGILLGRLAREVGLVEVIADADERRSDVELAIYREWHARTVAAASPLALDLLAHLGMGADTLALALRPRGDWRRWVCGSWPPKARCYARWTGAEPSPDPDADEREFFLHGCLVVREWGDPAGALGIRLGPAGLEIGARIGPVHLRTTEGVATITTGLTLPESVKVAAAGRPVERLFDHPVLRGRGYVVENQFDRLPTADDPRQAWRIEFRADPVPWHVPWTSFERQEVGRTA